jgi:hypothetical protein
LSQREFRFFNCSSAGTTHKICAVGAADTPVGSRANHDRAKFRERRDSRRPNFLAISALLHTVAARRGTRREARFVERFQAAVAEIGQALVQLSLMSDGLQVAAAEV